MLRENRLSVLANLIILVLMSSSICQALYTSFFMTPNFNLIIFLLVLPFTFLFYIMFKSKLTTIISAISIFLISIALFLYTFFVVGLVNASNWLNQYSKWFIDFYYGVTGKSSVLYTYITIVLISFIVTFIVYIFSMMFYNFFVLSIMLFGVFFVQLQLKIFASKASFVLFLFSFMLFYFFSILKKRSKDLSYNSGNKLMYLVCILPVCLFIVVFSLFLPVNEKRVEIPWLDSKFDFIVEYIFDNNKSDFDYFSFNATGFGNSGRLGGDIRRSKTHVLDVKSQSSKLYIKASSKALYNGASWYNDNNEFNKLADSQNQYSFKFNDDTNEFADGVFIETGSFKNDKIYKPITATINFVNLKTKSIFLPLKTNNLKFTKYITLLQDNEQIISTNNKQERGFSYTIDYNNMILNSDEFKNVLRKSHKGYYTNLFYSYFKYNSVNSALYFTSLSKVPSSEDSDSKLRNDRVVTLNEINNLISKASNAYDKYTQLPIEVPSRVKQLALNITNESHNTYDKAKAIETYLSTKYDYTLTPGKVPRDRDFVDYFLFDCKKGYCTYYASAMVVMLRSIGIPSRYVEGYVLPPTSEDGVYKVTNEQAHAWVEVYFEGFGWIPFEPTKSFVSKMYYDTGRTSESYDDNVSNSGYNSYLEYLEKMEKSKNKAGLSYDGSDIDPQENNESNSVFIILLIIAIVIGIILLAFIILVVTNTFKSYFSMRKIRKSEPNSSILLAYNYILKVLKTQNIVYKPSETPTEFGIRVEKNFDFKGYSFNKTSFIKVTNYYIIARYSKNSLSDKDKQVMIDFIAILLSSVIERIGKFNFMLTKYILGKI